MANTPVGTLKGYVALESPSTKFDEAGVYSCQVVFKGNDAQSMKKVIDGLMADSLSSAKRSKRGANPPYTIEGKELVVKFKRKARIKARSGEVYEHKVKLFDANAKLIEEELLMGEGTKVIINYSSYCWDVASTGAGCTLQPDMVQVLDLVKRSGGGGGNPFDEMEGFTAAKKDANPFEAPEVEEEAADTDDNEGDF